MMQNIIKSSNEGHDSTYGLHYFHEAITSAIHHFYISGEIGAAHYYTEMIHIIRTAGPSDVVYLHLNTTGGQLDTGIQLINAMRESSAHVVASIEAQAFSLGSMIFLAADDYIVHENSMLMIHNFSGSSAGKGNEQRLRLDAITTLFDQFVRPIYIPFITEDEFEDVIQGKDMWLQTTEIRDRLDLIAKASDSEANAVKPVSKRKTRTTKK